MLENKTITLNPGKSQEVVFEVSPTAPGTYGVRLNGLSGTFTVIEQGEAEFVVDSLVIQPNPVEVGEIVLISCRVTNIGNEAGTKTVNLEVT